MMKKNVILFYWGNTINSLDIFDTLICSVNLRSVEDLLILFVAMLLAVRMKKPRVGFLEHFLGLTLVFILYC